jgi:hypothetical protein
MLRRVALVRTDFSQELSTPFSRLTRICELGTTLAVTKRPILVTLTNFLISSDTSVPTRATRRNIPEDAILYELRSSPLVDFLEHFAISQRLISNSSTAVYFQTA